MSGSMADKGLDKRAKSTAKQTVCAYCRVYAMCRFLGRRYLCSVCARTELGESES